MAASLWVATDVGVKKGKRGEKKEPCWKDEEKLEGKERERLRN